MNDCYIALGSNLASPERQIRMAIRHLSNLPNSQLIQVAPFYRNPAMGLKNQPCFSNTVVHLKTRMAPLRLLDYCQSIERRQGRAKRRIWGSRTIDVDILIYGKRTMHHPRLTLPHPHHQQRDFVQIPLSLLT